MEAGFGIEGRGRAIVRGARRETTGNEGNRGRGGAAGGGRPGKIGSQVAHVTIRERPK